MLHSYVTFYTHPPLYMLSFNNNIYIYNIYIIITSKDITPPSKMLRNYVTCNLYIFSQQLKRRKFSSVATT